MTRIPASRYVCFALLVVMGTCWDLVTKSLVFADLGWPNGAGRVYPLVGNSITFQLVTSFNEGALWGLGQGYSWLFALLSVVAVAGVIYWLFFRGAAQSWWLTISLGFIVAGAFGNFYDRLCFHGWTDPITGLPKYAVRDFLLFTFGTYPWPVFNFADCFLVTGAIMLVLQSFQAELEPSLQSVETNTNGKTSQESKDEPVAATCSN